MPLVPPGIVPETYEPGCTEAEKKEIRWTRSETLTAATIHRTRGSGDDATSSDPLWQSTVEQFHRLLLVIDSEKDRADSLQADVTRLTQENSALTARVAALNALVLGLEGLGDVTNEE